MIAAIVHWSIRNHFIVILCTLLLLLAGIYAVKQTPIDAIPDLSAITTTYKTMGINTTKINRTF